MEERRHTFNLVARHASLLIKSGGILSSMFIAFFEVTSRMLFLTGVTGILSGGGLIYLSLSTLHKCTRRNGLATIGFGIAPNLRILNFREYNFVKNDVILRISIACPLLQEWYLSYCTKTKLSGWESIGLNCRNLERIDVSGCDNLSDAGLRALGNGCECLSVMYISHCTKLTSRVVCAFKTSREGIEIQEKEAMYVTPDWAFTT